MTSAGVPVAYALARGERPGGAALVGIALALSALAVVAVAPGHADAPGGTSTTVVVGMSTAAGVLFGAFFICFSRTSGDAGLWPVVL